MIFYDEMHSYLEKRGESLLPRLRALPAFPPVSYRMTDDAHVYCGWLLVQLVHDRIGTGDVLDDELVRSLVSAATLPFADASERALLPTDPYAVECVDGVYRIAHVPFHCWVGDAYATSLAAHAGVGELLTTGRLSGSSSCADDRAVTWRGLLLTPRIPFDVQAISAPPLVPQRLPGAVAQWQLDLRVTADNPIATPADQEQLVAMRQRWCQVIEEVRTSASLMTESHWSHLPWPAPPSAAVSLEEQDEVDRLRQAVPLPACLHAAWLVDHVVDVDRGTLGVDDIPWAVMATVLLPFPGAAAIPDEHLRVGALVAAARFTAGDTWEIASSVGQAAARYDALMARTACQLSVANTYLKNGAPITPRAGEPLSTTRESLAHVFAFSRKCSAPLVVTQTRSDVINSL